MAERRMFAKTVIDSDLFLDMPVTTQLLYFHLSMRADDDGFINNPKKIQRMVGCSNDDLNLLIAKNFIIPFDSGIVVIKHWKIHNYIRKDAYKETSYKEEKRALTLDENNSYIFSVTDTLQVCDETVTSPLQVCDETVTSPLQVCNSSVDSLLTQDRLGKDRLGKDSIDNNIAQDCANARTSKPKPHKQKFGPYQNVLLTEEEFDKLLQDFENADELIIFLDEYIEMKGYKAKSHYLAIRKWVVNAVEEQKQKQIKVQQKQQTPQNGLYTLKNGSQTSNPFIAMMEKYENE